MRPGRTTRRTQAAFDLDVVVRTRLADEGAGMIAIGMPRHQLHLVHRSVVFVALAVSPNRWAQSSNISLVLADVCDKRDLVSACASPI